MDLVYILRELWLRRGWVVLGVLLSCVVSLAVAFEVSLVPPSLGSRSLEHGTARSQLLVDTRPSTLADTGSDYEPLITRAGIFAQLFATGPVRQRVSVNSGIPSEEIETEAPSGGRPIAPNTPQPTREAGDVRRLSQIAAEGTRYRLALDVDEELPIISIAAQAPNEAQAARLANGSAEGLRQYIASLDPTSPEGRTVTIRVLGDAASDTVGEGISSNVAVASGTALFIGWCLLILIVSNVPRRWLAWNAGLLPVSERPPRGLDDRSPPSPAEHSPRAR